MDLVKQIYKILLLSLALEEYLVGIRGKIKSEFFFFNLVFTIPECLQNSVKWSLPVKQTFIIVLNVLFGPVKHNSSV